MKSNPANRPVQPGLRCTARAPERGRVVYAPCFKAARGFTLTEILIALALVLIITTLAAVDMRSIASGINHLPPAKVLEATVRQARYLAMSRMDTVILTYNSDGHSFDLLDDKGNVLEQDPDGADDPNVNIKLEFTKVLPLTDLATDPTTQTGEDAQFSKEPSSRLVFHASGATPPVKVTLTVDSNDSNFFLDSFSEGPPPKFPDVVPPLPPLP